MSREMDYCKQLVKSRQGRAESFHPTTSSVDFRSKRSGEERRGDLVCLYGTVAMYILPKRREGELLEQY